MNKMTKDEIARRRHYRRLTIGRVVLASSLFGLVLAALAFVPIRGKAAFQLPFFTASGGEGSIDGRSDGVYSPGRTRRVLQGDGWTNVIFVDRDPRNYVVRACRNNRRYQLTLGGRGDVRGSRELGLCRRGWDSSGATITAGIDQGRDNAGSTQNGARPDFGTDTWDTGQGSTRAASTFRDRTSGGSADRETTRQTQGASRPDFGADTWEPTRDRATTAPSRQATRRTDAEELDRDRWTSASLDRSSDVSGRRDPLRSAPIDLKRSDEADRNDNARYLQPGYRMSVGDAGLVLAGLGYQRVEFSDRTLPVYVADACLRRNYYRIRMNRRGDITFRERLGVCDRGGRRVASTALPLSEIEALLEGRGFNRISFTDRRPPTFAVEACKYQRRIALQVDGGGQITSRRRIGNCDNSTAGEVLDLTQVEDLLRKRRYYQINFTDDKLPWYVAVACRERKQFTLRLNRWGDINRREQTGVCDAPQRSEFVAAAPLQVLDFDAIQTRTRIDADECQDYLESLLNDNTITFATNSSKINENSFELLNRLAMVAKLCRDTQVEIAGHTDDVGSAQSNQRLSEARAKSVVDFLQERGVPQNRMDARGYGENRPIAPNTSKSGKARNRRIEFVATWGR